MYNYQINVKKILILCGTILLGFQNGVFGGDYEIGFDLSDKIYGMFQNISSSVSKNSYMSDSYSTSYSKDPFGDAMVKVDTMFSETQIAGAQYVSDLLSSNGCQMSDKKVWGILYYFVPEFRSDLSRKLKAEVGDFSTRKYVLDEDTLIRYCREYFACVETQGYSAADIYKNRSTKVKDENGNNVKDENERDIREDNLLRPISTGSPSDVKTNCKEFFEENYREGEQNEQMMQAVKKSQLGVDMYWNNSTDDSPYDIMVDLGMLSQLIYEDAEEPISPILFNLPTFSNSENKLKQSKSGGNASNGGENGLSNKGTQGNDTETIGDNSGSDEGGNDAGGGGEWGDDKGGDEIYGESATKGTAGGEEKSGDEGNQGVENANIPTPIMGNDFSLEDYYDLLEGLGAYSFVDNGLQGNICEEKIEEPEEDSQNVSTKSVVGLTASENDLSLDQLQEQEYQELIEYMLNAVKSYSSIPEPNAQEEKNEIGGKTDDSSQQSQESEIEETIQNIKDCYRSCEGMRLDKKATCMAKCTCGEIHSPIFDPNKNPGLGPIYIIKFCSVPSVVTNFSVGGKRIHSIEEGMDEIYGVTDKLSREGKLGTWTQQNEFLDSSTKQMKMSDSLSFTNSVEFGSISNEDPTHSTQYMEMDMEKNNEIWQSIYNILNSLDNPSTQNAYRLIGNGSEGKPDVVGSASNQNGNTSASDGRLETLVDINSDSDASRYVDFSEYFATWLDKQGQLWTQIYDYISNLDTYTVMLLNKRCE